MTCNHDCLNCKYPDCIDDTITPEERNASYSFDDKIKGLDPKIARKRAVHRVYYEAHKEEINAKKRAYNAAHRESVNAKQREYNAQHREEINARQREYNKTHRAQISEARKKRYAEIAKAEGREVKQNSTTKKEQREKANARARAYYAAHKEQIRAYQRRYQSKKAAEEMRHPHCCE